MASKLLSQYGFNRDKLKVLLGGWNSWNQLHGTDPNGYPTDVSTTAASPPAGVGVTVVPGNATAAPSDTTPGAAAPGLVTVPTTAP
ncbi:MAG TPA: hypothetical protein VM409_05700 [Chloroflexia bacterium]|nr:hypothetical protein [Chloroflexia bacterium]